MPVRKKEALVELYFKSRPQDRKDQYQRRVNRVEQRDLEAGIPPAAAQIMERAITRPAPANITNRTARQSSNKRAIEAGSLCMIDNEMFDVRGIFKFLGGMIVMPIISTFTGAAMLGYPVDKVARCAAGLSIGGILATSAFIGLIVAIHRGSFNEGKYPRIDIGLILAAGCVIFGSSVTPIIAGETSDEIGFSQLASASGIGVSLYAPIIGLGLFAHNRRIYNDYITRTRIQDDILVPAPSTAIPALEV